MSASIPIYDYFDTLDMNEALIEKWHRKAGGRVNVWVGLEHLFYADEAGQRRAIEIGERTQHRVSHALQRVGNRIAEFHRATASGRCSHWTISVSSRRRGR
jgi:5-methylthioadenosine/S-adenosylhomocysteine deaminase